MQSDSRSRLDNSFLGWLSSNNWLSRDNWHWLCNIWVSLFLSLLFLGKLRKEFFVFLMGLFGCLEAILLILLVELLSSKTGLGDQALYLRALVESLILSFDFASDNIFANIIFPFFKSESLDDIVSSLGTKSSWSLSIGKCSNFSGALNKNLKCNNSKIRSANASSDWLSLAFTSSSWSIKSSS